MRSGSAKKQGWSTMLEVAVVVHLTVIPSCSFYAPLRVVKVDMDTTAGDGVDSEPLTQQQQNHNQKE